MVEVGGLARRVAVAALSPFTLPPPPVSDKPHLPTGWLPGAGVANSLSQAVFDTALPVYRPEDEFFVDVDAYAERRYVRGYWVLEEEGKAGGGERKGQ